MIEVVILVILFLGFVAIASSLVAGVVMAFQADSRRFGLSVVGLTLAGAAAVGVVLLALT